MKSLKMTLKPPNLEDIEAYVREKNLTVDPEFFYDYFEAGEWIDSLGNPVKSWKQKMLTWHRANLRRGDTHKCYCGGIGVYIAGNDDTGQAIWRCINHKPKKKPIVTKEQSGRILKIVPEDKRSTSDKVNTQRKLLSKR